MNAKNTSDRMARPDTRMPTPVQRVMVTPPPESVIKCPHCGSARIGGWDTLGTWPGTAEHRKRCRACGIKVRMSTDYRTIRIIG